MKILVFVILVFVLAIPAYSQQKCANFTELTTGVSLCFPVGWKPHVRPWPAPGSPLLTVSLNDRVNGDTTFFLIDETRGFGKERESLGGLIEQIVANRLQGDKANGQTAELLSSTDYVTTSGIQGKRIMLRLTFPQAVTRAIYYVFKNETWSISILAMFEDANQKIDQTVDAIAKTFTFRRVPPSPTVPKSH